MKRTSKAYLYVLPALFIFALFYFYPIINGMWISFHEWGIRPDEFIGIGNYRELLNHRLFWRSLLFAFYYVLGTVPVEIALGLVIASLLARKIRGRNFFRLIYFLPYITSMVAIGIVWSWIFNPRYGPINNILAKIGISAPTWLHEPHGIFELMFGSGFPIKGPSLALVVMMAVTIWYFIGLHIVIFLSSLVNIPRDLYEAARIDGASRIQQFFKITVPLISPTTYMLTIVASIGAFQSFDLIYVMSSGGWGASGSSGAPMGTTRVLMLYIFDNFYRFSRTGYGAAATIMLFIILLSWRLLYKKILSKKIFYMGGS